MDESNILLAGWSRGHSRYTNHVSLKPVKRRRSLFNAVIATAWRFILLRAEPRQPPNHHWERRKDSNLHARLRASWKLPIIHVLKLQKSYFSNLQKALSRFNSSDPPSLKTTSPFISLFTQYVFLSSHFPLFLHSLHMLMSYLRTSSSGARTGRARRPRARPPPFRAWP